MKKAKLEVILLFLLFFVWLMPVFAKDHEFNAEVIENKFHCLLGQVEWRDTVRYSNIKRKFWKFNPDKLFFRHLTAGCINLDRNMQEVTGINVFQDFASDEAGKIDVEDYTVIPIEWSIRFYVKQPDGSYDSALSLAGFKELLKVKEKNWLAVEVEPEGDKATSGIPAKGSTPPRPR